jgi:hypothetical protein
MYSGNQIKSAAEGTLGILLVCRKCETMFSFEESAQNLTRLGIRAKVAMCPFCYCVYDTSVTPRGVKLMGDVSEQYPGIRAEAERIEPNKQKCSICHQVKEPGAVLTCNRCGHVNWGALAFWTAIPVSLITATILLPRFRTITPGWVQEGIFCYGLFGLIFSLGMIVEWVRAIRTPKTYTSLAELHHLLVTAFRSSPEPEIARASRLVDQEVASLMSTTLLVELCTRNDILYPTNMEMLANAKASLKIEGEEGSRALARLIEELLNSRNKEIGLAIEAAQAAQPIAELLAVLQSVVTAEPIRRGSLGRFTPEIADADSVGWTDSTARGIKELATKTLEVLSPTDQAK